MCGTKYSTASRRPTLTHTIRERHRRQDKECGDDDDGADQYELQSPEHPQFVSLFSLLELSDCPRKRMHDPEEEAGECKGEWNHKHQDNDPRC